MVTGEIYIAVFTPRSGSKQQGRRPCIIVSHNAFSDAPGWHSLTVVPLTSARRWLVPSPTTVMFEKGECGLPKKCAALAHQITTIDKSKLRSPAIGTLTDRKLEQLDQALRNYLVL